MLVSKNKGSINNDWLYKKNVEEAGELVHLPHTNQEVPYNYFDEKMYQFKSYYEKELIIGESDRHFVVFEGVMTAFKLYIDNQYVGEYKGGYIPHRIELTDFVEKGKVHKMHVEVDSTEREDIPPFGHVVDYLTFGGIYRDVWYCQGNQTTIKNLYFKYEVAQHNGKVGNVKCSPIIEIDNRDVAKEVHGKLTIANETISFCVQVKSGTHRYVLDRFELEEVALWDIDRPNMYTCEIEIHGERSEDTGSVRVGFRQVEIDADIMKLNGRSLTLRGLNRHQSYPYVGYAMPKRVQEEDAIILKKELGLNTVRTSHYPQSPYFLDQCDELGLMVLEEIPGWQHVSHREDWRQQVLNDVRAMIERDYNHPSIITWGVRINESRDDEELYTQTNTLARELDDTRPTSGVRCSERSQLLEDIYTMNDFVHDGSDNILRTRTRCTGLEQPVPYMVTEFCGHIYPTKKFDQEERIVEHALRHGRVQSMAAQRDEVLGAIGWCAFDYYTHYDFGSGDRICYHGVMDMFRTPKFAAAVYKSQRKPSEGYVMEPLTYWTRGERNRGIVFPIHVFTNCDTIEIKMGGVSKGMFTRQFFNTDSKMQYLDYPPFVISMNNGEWGASWTDAEFIGYANGEAVINKKFAANPIYAGIEVITAENVILDTTCFDATRVEVRIVDQVGNTLPYIHESITLETIGAIDVIGPKTVTVAGGSMSFWVRTKVGEKSEGAKVKVTTSRGDQKEITIQLI